MSITRVFRGISDFLVPLILWLFLFLSTDIPCMFCRVSYDKCFLIFFFFLFWIAKASANFCLSGVHFDLRKHNAAHSPVQETKMLHFCRTEALP